MEQSHIKKSDIGFDLTSIESVAESAVLDDEVQDVTKAISTVNIEEHDSDDDSTDRSGTCTETDDECTDSLTSTADSDDEVPIDGKKMRENDVSNPNLTKQTNIEDIAQDCSKCETPATSNNILKSSME